MRFSTVDSITPARLTPELPITLTQKSARASAWMALAILVPTTLALLTPFVLLGEAIASDPAVRTVIQERPQLALQLAIGLVFWAVLFAWPLKRLIDGLARSRTISIAGGLVSIEDKSLLGTKTWAMPLASYTGVIHHVRASLSGLRHELILAHPDHKNSVLLTIADRISQTEIDQVSLLLGHREVPSATIYTFRANRRARVPEALPQAA